MRFVALLSMGLVAGLLASGCSEDPHSCASDGDCFSGEACISGVCQAQLGSDAGPNNGNANNGHDNDATANNGGTNNDSANNGTTNNGSGDDAGSEDDASANNGAAGVCEVDPFEATCDNDDEYDNEDWIDANDFKDGSLGCYGSHERPEDWSKTIEGVLCHDEAADFYSISTMVPCESSFRVRATLTVPEECTEAGYEFVAYVGGAEIACDETRDYMSARCERDGNVSTWTIIAEPANTVWTLYFGVRSNQDLDVQFDYTLEGQVL